ncbi:TetR/AcrR family transcriptional regulator [Aliiroseovarius crassostreae]|uniref:TetR/AcrR family transcriptional regulator n=1 Tax=Aliiroseovarius crassostreae TaxID=154981 RepID=UPI003C7D6C00
MTTRTRKPASVRKTEITRTAMDLAFEVGPDRVTTALIADRLGLTQPAIYKHFPSKDDIWDAVTDALCQRIDANIRAAADHPRPLDQLRALVMGQLRLLHDHPALPEIMVMRDPTADTTAVRTRVTLCMGGLRAAIHRAMREGQSVGEIRSDLDTEDSTNLLISVVQGLALRLLRFRETENFLSTGARLLDLQLRLLTTQGEIT